MPSSASAARIDAQSRTLAKALKRLISETGKALVGGDGAGCGAVEEVDQAAAVVPKLRGQGEADG